MRTVASRMAVALAPVLGLPLGGCAPTGPGPDTVVVFAAASTAPAVEQLAEAFGEAEGARVVVSAASSSTLAHQIEAGAEADVFVSASPEWTRYLAEAGRLEPGSTRVFATNRLVLIAPRDATGEVDTEAGAETVLAELPPFDGRLAVGDPTHVPLGRYTEAALRSLGGWDAVRERLAPALDARAALRLVESGETRAGIVYESDARSSRRVRIVGRIPDAVPIEYSASLVGKGTDPAGPTHPARAFHEHLTSEAAERVLDEHGFRAARP